MMACLSLASLVILSYLFSIVAAQPVPSTGAVRLQPYGQTDEGQVYLITLQRGPIRMNVTNWGARITSLYLPDAKGQEADVVLGFDSLEAYKNVSDPYFGAIVGRVANRIANGTFMLDHVRYNLTKNDGNNTLHGGKVGFDKVLWQLEKVINEGDGPSVTLSYHSFDGEQGFPGSLKVTVTYTLVNDTDLAVDMTAEPGNKSTPVNLAQHTYWNLGGHNSGTILNNTIQIFGNKVTVVDKELIPTGQMASVKKTPYDLREEHLIATRIDKLNEGFDINYALKGGHVIELSRKNNKKGKLKLAAKVYDPLSHRALEVYTNKPGLQFYSGNQLNGIMGKDGAVYGLHDGLCLETQGFPDSVNHPNFPSIIVNPGESYHHFMLYHFFIMQAQ